MINSIPLQHGVSGLLFIAVLSVFLLLIYEYVSVGSLKKCALDTGIFVFLILLISYVTGPELNRINNYKMLIPFPVLIIISVLLIIYSLIKMLFERKKNEERLTPNSVKEAFDNLNSGICFTDENSRIVLINYAMSSLISSVLKRYPQTLNEIYDALNKVERLADNLYKFNNESVWQLSRSELDSFTQLSLQEVTELFETNRQLEKENEQLTKTNEEIQKMLERLADRIREEETLKLKIQIHDDIGTSLIRISKLINESDSEDINKQLTLLESAVSFFSNNKSPAWEDLDGIMKKAEGLGVKLFISGSIPDSKTAKELVFLAMGECLTNCVIHAQGNEVYVDITENENDYSVEISNNGNAPEGEITEGGGLSSLRKRVEGANGIMLISPKQGFTLSLVLKKENQND